MTLFPLLLVTAYKLQEEGEEIEIRLNKFAVVI
jgi:hypothetical protein